MKLKYEFTIQKMGDQYCASPIQTSNFNGALFFSEVGKTIFEELKYEININALVDRLMKKYIGERATIEKEVDKFISILKSNDLVED